MPVLTARDRLDRIVSIVWRSARFWKWSAGLVLAISIASLGFAITRPRVYRSETLILYREGIRSTDLGGPDVGDPARKLGMKLKEMVLSRTSLRQIIDAFHLYPKLVEDRGYVDAVDDMRGHIAFRIRDGDTFGLSFEGSDPKQVQEVTAKLAEVLIDENSKNRVEQAMATKEFLDAEKDRNEKDLKERETALATFLAEHPEFAREQVAGAGTAIRATQQKSKNAKADNTTLMALQREADRIAARLGQPTAPRPVKFKERDPKLTAAVSQAEAEVATAQKELSEKISQFTEQHPDVLAARKRVAQAEAKLQRAEDALTRSPLEPDLASSIPEAPIDRPALEEKLKNLRAEIGAEQKRQQKSTAEPPSTDASWIVTLETDWTRLNREVVEARERQRQVEDKQFRATLSASSVGSGHGAQMVVVDPAYLPTHPSATGRTVIAGTGIVVAVALGFLLALGCALLDDRLYDRADVERLGTIELLATVPRARGGSRRV